jgi:hypothetical protein
MDESTKERSTGRAHLVRESVFAGLLAGVIFAIGEMFVGRALGNPLLAPWRGFASLLLGHSALEGRLTFGIFLAGLIAHFALSAIYGGVWGVIVSYVPYQWLTSRGAQAALGGLYGLALYLLNFLVIAPLLYPWFRETNQPAQTFFHVVLFGLPLGAYLGARLHPAEGMRAVRQASM